MSAAEVLHSHQKDLGGGFVVRRLLPAAAKQAVGPFIFFDHFGPIEVPPHADHDVRPHPHIGLATVTYLFEGAMEHRDSVGSVQRIEPGAVNWMTAGSGIVHSERTPKDLAGRARRTHGLQLWAALPLEHEEAPPGFSHTPAAALPQATVGAAQVKVLIGSAFGMVSPVRTYSPTLYLDVCLGAGQPLRLTDLPPEAAIYPVGGALEVDGVALAEHAMLLLERGAPALVRARDGANARFVVIGGEPIGHRFIFWNFVSSSKERIARAADDWSAQRFDRVPGETEFIPLPRRP
ncbi:MAG: pirin family protein [Pseudomonadota bacterium]